jgi:hypothetical protein
MHFFAYLIDLGLKKLWKIKKPIPTPSRGPELKSESNLDSQKFPKSESDSELARH